MYAHVETQNRTGFCKVVWWVSLTRKSWNHSPASISGEQPIRRFRLPASAATYLLTCLVITRRLARAHHSTMRHLPPTTHATTTYQRRQIPMPAADRLPDAIYYRTAACSAFSRSF